MLAVTPASGNNNTSGNNTKIITYTNKSLSNILNEDNTIFNNFNNLKTKTDTKNSLSNILNEDDTTIILILLLLTWWWGAIYSKIKNLENKNLKLKNIIEEQESYIIELLIEVIKHHKNITSFIKKVNWEGKRYFDNAIKNWNAGELLKIILDNEWLNNNTDTQNKLILKILWLDTKDITIKFLNKNLEISWNKSTERPEYYTNFEELINTLFNAQINRIKITRKHDFNYEIDITEQENFETKIREIDSKDKLNENEKRELKKALEEIIEAKKWFEDFIESVFWIDFSIGNIKNFLNKELNLINKVNIIISSYFDKHPFDSKI